MKRFMFLVAAAALAATAAPSQAAFTLTAQIIGGGPGGGNTSIQTFGPSTGSGIIDLFDGVVGSGTDVQLQYTASSTSTSVNVGTLSLVYNNEFRQALPRIQVRLIASENEITVPGPAGSQGNFSVSFEGIGSNNSNLTASAELTQMGGGATIPSEGPIPFSPNAPVAFTRSVTFTQGNDPATIRLIGVFDLEGYGNANIGAVSVVAGPTVNPIPVPATALMGVVALPLFGAIRRFRRTAA